MKSIFSNAILYSVSTSIVRFTLLGLAVVWSIIADVNMSASWSVAVSLAPLFGFLIDASFSRSTLRLFYDIDSGDFDADIAKFYQIRLKYVLASTILTVVLAYASWDLLSGGKLGATTYFFALILYGLGESNSLFYSIICRLRGEAKKLAFFRISQAFLAASTAVISYELFDVSTPFVAFSSVYFLSSFIPHLRRVGPALRSKDPNAAIITDIRSYALPLTFHDLSWWLRGSASAVVIANFYGAEATSTYFLIFMLITPLTILISGFDQSIEGEFYRARMEGSSLTKYRDIYELLMLAIFCFFLIATTATSFSHLFFDTLTTDMIKNTVPIVFLIPMFHASYSVWVKGLFFKKMSKSVLGGTLGGSIIGITLSWVLTDNFGYSGAAIAALVAFAIIAIYGLIVSSIYDQRPIAVFYPVFLLLVAITYTVLLRVMNTNLQLTFWMSLVLVAGLLGLSTGSLAVLRHQRVKNN